MLWVIGCLMLHGLINCSTCPYVDENVNDRIHFFVSSTQFCCDSKTSFQNENVWEKIGKHIQLFKSKTSLLIACLIYSWEIIRRSLWVAPSQKSWSGITAAGS